MTQQYHWHYLPVNPEPWAIGSLGVGKRGGKVYPYIGPNLQLKVAQEAIQEALEYPTSLPDGKYSLRLFFWRRIDKWTGASGRKGGAHEADVTNLQKATEDALQGLLFKNDRDVRDIHSTLVDQGPDVKPGILIGIRIWDGEYFEGIPSDVMYQRNQQDYSPSKSDNTWITPT